MTHESPMKTAPSRRMFAYWNERRGSRLAPERGDIEPGAIRQSLGDSFIITYDPTDDHPFRLAGTRVCALFGRELKGTPFVPSMGHGASRVRIRGLAATVADRGEPGRRRRRRRAPPRGRMPTSSLLLLPLYHCAADCMVRPGSTWRMPRGSLLASAPMRWPHGPWRDPPPGRRHRDDRGAALRQAE